MVPLVEFVVWGMWSGVWGVGFGGLGFGVAESTSGADLWQQNLADFSGKVKEPETWNPKP